MSDSGDHGDPLGGRWARPGDEASEMICYCMRIRERTLLRAIRAGVKDLEALREATRAGTGCGTCRIDLIRLLASARRTDGAR